MKKVIFLDIDGVLATHREFMMNRNKFNQKNPWAKELRVPYGWNKGCVKAFNEILEATDATIVLSSDWKMHWDLEELDKIFKANGVIKSPEFVTHNQSRHFSSDLEDNRHYQIKSWIIFNKPERWVAIDDLNMKPHFKFNGFEDNFFLTKDMEGLKQTGLKDKIIKFLNDEQKQKKTDNKG